MKRVLITRPQAQARGMSDGLLAAGYEPVFFPVIEIQPMQDNRDLDEALEHLTRYGWIVFTSANAVDVVFGRPQARIAAKSMQNGVGVAAIGPKTAKALQAHGVTPDFVPKEYVAEAIVPGMGDLHGKRVLLPRAEIARKALPQAIAAAGGVPHEIAVYRTLPARPSPEAFEALRTGVDVISLTSPSTVANFITILRQSGIDPFHLAGNPLIACIGPITETAARGAGFKNVAVAEEYTAEGLIHLIAAVVQE
jgi:uroporphyrinogen III methyltransferase / synthase